MRLKPGMESSFSWPGLSTAKADNVNAFANNALISNTLISKTSINHSFSETLLRQRAQEGRRGLAACPTQPPGALLMFSWPGDFLQIDRAQRRRLSGRRLLVGKPPRRPTPQCWAAAAVPGLNHSASFV